MNENYSQIQLKGLSDEFSGLQRVLTLYKWNLIYTVKHSNRNYPFVVETCHCCQIQQYLRRRLNPANIKQSWGPLQMSLNNTWPKQNSCFSLWHSETWEHEPETVILTVPPVSTHRKQCWDNDAIHQTETVTRGSPYAKWYRCVLRPP